MIIYLNKYVNQQNYDHSELVYTHVYTSLLCYVLVLEHCFQPEIEKAKLYCWYERNSDRAWLISPLKMEAYSWEPYLVQIHDVIGKKVIDFLTETAIPNMQRARTVGIGENGSPIPYETKFRTSTSTSLDENDVEDGKVLQ
jgi:hypothetical protein